MTDNDLPSSKPPIVLINGLWLTPRAWEPWVAYYESSGYSVTAPSWPGAEGGVEAIRADPSPLNGLGVIEVADHYETIIRGLDSPPIIMGHSFGGVLTQILLGRGLGVAGIAIDSAPVKGVLRLPFASLKSAFPVLKNPANRHRTVALTPAQWHYGFCNTLSRAESDTLYEQFHVPTPGRPLWQAATANFSPNAATKVDLSKNDRAPLLLISGGADHTVPPAMNRENYRRYSKSSAVTEYEEFPGRPHFTIGVAGWEAVADRALSFANTHLAGSPTEV